MNKLLFQDNMFSYVERSNTASKKWDNLTGYFGRTDIVPLSIADMDFEVDKNIKESLQKRAEHAVYGYVHQTNEFFGAIKNWQKKSHNWDIESDWITTSPGVVAAQAIVVLSLTNEQDEIIIQSPAYPPFFSVVEGNNRIVVENPLKCKNGRYEMDFEDLENKVSPRTKMIFLCSPHNPSGRCWSRNELVKLGEFAKKYNLIIMSDEIFGDLVYNGCKHIPIASISEEFENRTITCASPSKTFNLAGLSTAYTIIKNEEYRNKYRDKLGTIGIDEVNNFGLEALISAYNKGEEWKNKLILYLEDNRNYLEEFFKSRIPEIKVIHSEATYMALLDCRELTKDADKLQDFFVNYAKVGLKNGHSFGSDGSGFMRITYACNRGFLEESLTKIELALRNNVDFFLE